MKLKQFLPRSLLGRSLLILITPVILIQVVATYMFFTRHWDVMTERLALAVAGEVALFADSVERGASQKELQRMANDMARFLDLEVTYQDGKVLENVTRHHRDWGSVVAQTLSYAIQKRVQKPYDIQTDVGGKFVKISLQLTDGVLEVISPQNRLFSASARIYILWVIGSSAFLLLIAVLFMRNQIRPIRRLAIAAEKLGKGRDVPFFKPEGAQEVRAAAQAFIDMRARIDRQIQQRTSMLAGVSHDLRTPLTRMKLQAELMGNSPDVQDLKSDIADMERMISAYLDFVRGQGDEEPQRTALEPLLTRLVASAGREGGAVTLDIRDDDISLMVRPIALERALVNLIGNAAKYAPQSRVTVTREEDGVRLIFDDNGPGIPPALRDDVFKPFFRVETSRNPQTGGVGLGLPIAQDIIHAHGGTIDLGDSPMGGLRINVFLPA
ncbi:MAG: HAMP domain-containing protein [Alphaproteobacteria bacterium]|nr:HAMP domain-containing protein [Alphaproteobacteria bacterium]